ncbi:CPBP family intramembrane glutamic endopeptidase [Gandjariella thermophila]|uniref:CPBP family intramembrane glutamic endopeptidase n=1 Tax=Gandjariella thermophila TaxID=1931992 RepID=UPI001CEF590A|nr:type II CAAX endopeptidase family protein [Gandjariella thermophila]
MRDWVLPERPAGIVTIDEAEQRRAATWELLIVFSITLGLSALRSLLSLLDSLLKPGPLNRQSVALNVPQAAAHLIDLLLQLANVLQLAAWGALGVYLLWRTGTRAREIGLDRRHPAGDLAKGVGLAALIGIPGLGFYLLARALGLNLTVLPSTLTDTWWRAPVLVLAAIGNAWAEEALVVGYLITRLRQFGWRENRSLLASAVLRGSYHLYQGFGGFLGNVVMGLVFGRAWQRTNRLWALVVAHALLDVVAFVGYTVLHGHVRWLP